jgi:hypothetical protein
MHVTLYSTVYAGRAVIPPVMHAARMNINSRRGNKEWMTRRRSERRVRCDHCKLSNFIKDQACMASRVPRSCRWTALPLG